MCLFSRSFVAFLYSIIGHPSSQSVTAPKFLVIKKKRKSYKLSFNTAVTATVMTLVWSNISCLLQFFLILFFLHCYRKKADTAAISQIWGHETFLERMPRWGGWGEL